VLRYLKLDPNSKRTEDLTKAGDTVFRIRDNVRKFHSSEYINGLAGGDICMALGFSGDILQARKRAKEAGNGVDIEYVIPKEGAQMWFDSMVIPKDAPNAENAYILINYLLRPDVAAANSNLVEYANANEETMKRLFTNTAFDERLQRHVTRVWTRVKTGR
jgi:putrescine transport system substrate-binding protein